MMPYTVHETLEQRPEALDAVLFTVSRAIFSGCDGRHHV